ncbi:DEAD/DEAH box helicase, partial [Mangrovactinospora gilvigrisea]|uniref:DEAD/DEAH box helicase n=1 Tax=Mangrovactinospora gilvigrisea TaxID=1428644 RepID=UPI003012A535
MAGTARTDGIDLPVRSALPALRAALFGAGAAGGAVLVAPPGTGKTTLVPPALAGLLGDGAPARRVLVAEPRRVAARAAARRIAWLLGERAGEGAVGFTVRGERRVGPRCRVEVVTTGVLLRRLQRDPELPGVDAVLLDEVHERHLDADLALAFLQEVRGALRPELAVVAASATAETGPLAALLEAPVVEAEGVAFPVAARWAAPPAGVRPALGTRVDPALLDHAAAVVRRALAEEASGDVLVFLPGAAEIAGVAGRLRGAVAADVLTLHGRTPAHEQDAVLAGGGGGS